MHRASACSRMSFLSALSSTMDDIHLHDMLEYVTIDNAQVIQVLADIHTEDNERINSELEISTTGTGNEADNTELASEMTAGDGSGSSDTDEDREGNGSECSSNDGSVSEDDLNVKEANKRQSFTLYFKIQGLEALENNSHNYSATARQLNIPRSNLQRLKKEEK